MSIVYFDITIVSKAHKRRAAVIISVSARSAILVALNILYSEFDTSATSKVLFIFQEYMQR